MRYTIIKTEGTRYPYHDHTMTRLPICYNRNNRSMPKFNKVAAHAMTDWQ